MQHVLYDPGTTRHTHYGMEHAYSFQDKAQVSLEHKHSAARPTIPKSQRSTADAQSSVSFYFITARLRYQCGEVRAMLRSIKYYCFTNGLKRPIYTTAPMHPPTRYFCCQSYPNLKDPPSNVFSLDKDNRASTPMKLHYCQVVSRTLSIE